MHEIDVQNNTVELPETYEGSKYEFCSLASSVKEKSSDYGYFFQVNLKLDDGRFVTFKAKNAEDVITIFEPAKELKQLINVTDTVKWVSNDKKIISLSTRSTKYRSTHQAT
ncbi:MAG: hypothetical protein QXN55_00945 [Candidatus Nitrosotenuis sp.]